MSRHEQLSALQEHLGLKPLFDKIASGPIVVAARTSNNTARDNAVQVCGPVAGSIQYVFNFSVHVHSGAHEEVVARFNHHTGHVETGNAGIPKIDCDLPPMCCHLKQAHPDVEAKRPLRLHPRQPARDAGSQTVLATFNPKVEGNWIASRIVKRLGFTYHQDSCHKDVPPNGGRSFNKTRIYMDLTCGGKDVESRACRHRFYVVNDFDFDMLVGSKL